MYKQAEVLDECRGRASKEVVIKNLLYCRLQIRYNDIIIVLFKLINRGRNESINSSSLHR